jgi:CBS domain-containing protein
MATAERAREVRCAMITRPRTHGPGTTVGELRAFFEDDHVHVALLVDEGKLLGVVERDDLQLPLDDSMPGCAIAELDGTTAAPDSALADAYTAMKRDGRRRLAVTTGDSILLGLLCLKRSGLGFCSDEGVLSRRRQPGRGRP